VQSACRSCLPRSNPVCLSVSGSNRNRPCSLSICLSVCAMLARGSRGWFACVPCHASRSAVCRIGLSRVSQGQARMRSMSRFQVPCLPTCHFVSLPPGRSLAPKPTRLTQYCTQHRTHILGQEESNIRTSATTSPCLVSGYSIR
jgi:hypothetical protein